MLVAFSTLTFIYLLIPHDNRTTKLQISTKQKMSQEHFLAVTSPRECGMSRLVRQSQIVQSVMQDY